VYIDDGSASDSGELEIDVDGHEYVEAENYSLDHDGIVDSVSVATADGGHLVYSDTDHDGHADLVTGYDEQGAQQEQAHYDPTSGRWIDARPGGDGSLTVDTAAGQVPIGPATVDTDGDHQPDTAVVHDAQGDTVLYTDTDGDGHADVATELRPDGEVVIADHTGPGEWAVQQRGHLDGAGDYQVDSADRTTFVPPIAANQAAARDAAGDGDWGGGFGEPGASGAVVRIDAATGQWISRN
jgi:hypothetical protein